MACWCLLEKPSCCLMIFPAINSTSCGDFPACHGSWDWIHMSLPLVFQTNSPMESWNPISGQGACSPLLSSWVDLREFGHWKRLKTFLPIRNMWLSSVSSSFYISSILWSLDVLSFAKLPGYLCPLGCAASAPRAVLTSSRARPWCIASRESRRIWCPRWSQPHPPIGTCCCLQGCNKVDM